MHFCLLIVAVSMSTVAAKIVAISAVVFAVLQALKKAPAVGSYLHGWLAIALNVALSVTGVLMVVAPAQVFSLQTLLTVLTAALSASGIHGAYSSMRPNAASLARKSARINLPPGAPLKQ